MAESLECLDISTSVYSVYAFRLSDENYFISSRQIEVR